MENILDIVKNIGRAQEIQGKRTGVRDNPTGKTMQADESKDYSTHLMKQADSSIFPMLYQIFGQWKQFKDKDWREAMDFAEQQGELYDFNSPEEAKEWAEGRWKQKNLEPFINSLVERIMKNNG